MNTLTALLAQHGLSLVFFNVLLSQLGVPLPAVPMLIVAGALVADGTMQLVPLAVVVVIASLFGDLPWYYAGRHYGYRVLRTLCRMSMEPDTCVKQTENIFARWGPPSLIVAKYIPGFSTVAPPLAGTMRLALAPFLAYSAGAALLWAALPVAGGFFFRTEVEWLLAKLEAMGPGALAVIAAAIASYIAIKAIERHLLIRHFRMVRVSPDVLRAMIDEGQDPVILDVRSPLAREAEPRLLPGAISVELDALERIALGVPPDRDVIVYCS